MRLLTIITTNRERDLPQAFLRRCVRLDIEDPRDVDSLVRIAAQHYPSGKPERMGMVGETLLRLRDKADKLRLRRPGTAEFLDAVHACEKLDLPVSKDPGRVWSQIERAILAKDDTLRASGR